MHVETREVGESLVAPASPLSTMLEQVQTISYFVLARRVALDHTLYLSALSTAASSTLSDPFTFINFN